MNRRRIAIVTPGFDADEHDRCIPVQRQLIRRLREQVDLEVFPLRYPDRTEPYTVDRVSVFPSGGGTLRGLARYWVFRRAIRGLRVRHDARPFDLVLAMWADEPGWIATRFAREVGIPSLVWILGGELVDLPDIGYGGQRGWFGPRLVRGSLRRSDRILIPSAYIGNLARSWGELDKVRTLPLGVELDLFDGKLAKAPIDLAGSPVLLAVASWTPVKNPRLLLEAVARVREREPELALHMVGELHLETSIRNWIHELDLTHSVFLWGPMAQNQLPQLFASADLHLTSSHHESESLVVLEAGAMGTVTVGTRVGILPELAPECVSVEVMDPASLAEAILDQLGNRSRLQSRGLALQRRIRNEFSLETTLKDLLAEFDSVTS